ncbi:MAG: stress response protein [Candidatus Omnitrophica bacterium]|nr:stress response protein [Candidatus Omnitrophota bacterium]
MELKPKIVLKDKNASASVGTIKQMRIVLQWKAKVDLDLMLFGKNKDGSNFSIFTKRLGGSQGDLNSFPFINMEDDAGVDLKDGDKEEFITINKIDASVDELYIVCLNYTDASEGNSVSFSNYDASINMVKEDGSCLVQGQLNSTETGVAAHLCTIKNGAIGAEFINVGKIMSLDTLVTTIPGANALTK